MGDAEEERGIVADAPDGSAARPGQCIVSVDPRYFRPSEVGTLLGDATKAREKLGWTPRTTFHELIAEMVAADLAEAERDALVVRHGYNTPNYHE